MTDVACCQAPSCPRIDPVRSMYVLRPDEHTLDMNDTLRLCSDCNRRLKR